MFSIFLYFILIFSSGIVIGDGYHLTDETVPFLAGKCSGFMGSVGEIVEDSLVETNGDRMNAYAICENCCRAIESDGGGGGSSGAGCGGGAGAGGNGAGGNHDNTDGAGPSSLSSSSHRGLLLSSSHHGGKSSSSPNCGLLLTSLSSSSAAHRRSASSDDDSTVLILPPSTPLIDSGQIMRKSRSISGSGTGTGTGNSITLANQQTQAIANNRSTRKGAKNSRTRWRFNENQKRK